MIHEITFQGSETELHLSRLVIHSLGKVASLPLFLLLLLLEWSGRRCVYLSEFSGYSARNWVVGR